MACAPHGQLSSEIRVYHQGKSEQTFVWRTRATAHVYRGIYDTVKFPCLCTTMYAVMRLTLAARLYDILSSYQAIRTEPCAHIAARIFQVM